MVALFLFPKKKKNTEQPRSFGVNIQKVKKSLLGTDRHSPADSNPLQAHISAHESTVGCTQPPWAYIPLQNRSRPISQPKRLSPNFIYKGGLQVLGITQFHCTNSMLNSIWGLIRTQNKTDNL